MNLLDILKTLLFGQAPGQLDAPPQAEEERLDPRLSPWYQGLPRYTELFEPRNEEEAFWEWLNTQAAQVNRRQAGELAAQDEARRFIIGRGFGKL